MAEGVSGGSFVRLDNGAVTSRSIVGDIDIIFDISNDIDNTVDNDNDNFNDENDETLSFCPSNIEVEESLNKFRILPCSVLMVTLKMETLLNKERLQSLKWSVVSDYFQQLQLAN